MKLGIAILAIILAGCGSPGVEASGGDGPGVWTYAEGPNGENCLFYSEGVGDNHVLAMSCDSVNP